jgi:tyrosyl-tRNA synthetase
MQDVVDILRERGFVQDISDEAELRERLTQPITLYCGYDATATSLHVGNLVTIMMLAHFQRCGHRPIALMGGGTTMIGDPSGKTTSRPILSEAEIEQNLQSIKGQFARFLDFEGGRALMVNNAEWLKPLTFIGFMRDIGSRFSVNEMLRLEAYRTRLEAGGLTFLEFSYVLVQSYDFLRLYQDRGCILQIGASDQWGNCISGADLIRRVTGGQAFVLVAPLLITAEGTKMGKTERGAVWLDSRLTSPYDYYQYWRNTDDRVVERNLAIFTFLPMDEVRRLGCLEGAELNQAKEILAFEATKLLHGEEEAQKAQAAARALFGGLDSADSIPTYEIDLARLEEGIPVTQLFKETGLVDSANDARRQIAQSSLTVNGERVTDPSARIDRGAMQNGHLMLSRGKKQHMRVVGR